MTTAGQQMDEERFAHQWGYRWQPKSHPTVGTISMEQMAKLDAEQVARHFFLAGKAYGLELRGCCEHQETEP